MADAFVSLIAVQPTHPQMPKPGEASNTPANVAQSPSGGLYTVIREGGVKTK